MIASPGSISPENPQPKRVPNRLETIRVELGLSKAELARLSDLSEKTITRLEDQMDGHRENGERFRAVTYSRILNALNSVRRKIGKAELSQADVFPS